MKVTTEGEFDAKAFVEVFVRIVRNMEREGKLDPLEFKKTPKTKSSSNKKE
ncbi:NAD-glutamate dehydrogenase [Bacillus wiedmannii]|uniref:NAD-glutamate dehydrogenase n=1 Tax=Bacillus wiedmannii TaxID=1890302 RepID=UPI001145EE42|nr:NAD-glutamate dehydrogenase [Bacillus wiedmannii]